jgi:hypothetical protein
MSLTKVDVCKSNIVIFGHLYLSGVYTTYIQHSNICTPIFRPYIDYFHFVGLTSKHWMVGHSFYNNKIKVVQPSEKLYKHV